MSNNKQLPSYVTGDYFDGDEPDALALGSFDYIARDLNDIKHSYFRLGFHLDECDRCKYWQQFGYSCLSDFALHNWGLESSFVSRCIAVFKFTAQYSGALPTMFQQDKYKPYSYSQLVEMISMDEDTLRRCSPNYSVRELREIKKNAKKRKQIATSQSEKKFDYEKYFSLSGAALSAYCKFASSLRRVRIFVVDAEGKAIPDVSNTLCDVLFDDSNHIIFRML